jgi:hypothetical protein
MGERKQQLPLDIDSRLAKRVPNPNIRGAVIGTALAIFASLAVNRLQTYNETFYLQCIISFIGICGALFALGNLFSYTINSINKPK